MCLSIVVSCWVGLFGGLSCWQVMMMRRGRRASLRSPASGKRDSSHLGGLARDLGDIQRQHLAFAAASEVKDTKSGPTKIIQFSFW